MSVDYYLFCRKSYDIIIRELDYIISVLKEMDEYTQEEEQPKLKSDIALPKQSDNKLFFSSRKEHMQFLKQTCDKKIMELCNHEFITDTIDIDQDRSKTIRYCRICEYTDPN